MKSYNIYIQPNDYKYLRSNVWTDEYVPGYLKDGKNKYQIDISYRGHSIRNYDKKSYNILFQNPHTIKGAHEIHLNAESKDPSLIRNKLSLDFFHEIGIIAPQSQHVTLTINGQRRGLYLQLESFDEYSLRRRNLANGSIFYATDDDANFSLLTAEGDPKLELLQGYTPKYVVSKEEKKLFAELILSLNTLSNLEFEERIPKILDVDNYLTWLAGVVCIQHFDGFDHNYAMYYNSSTQLLEISPWDCDGTWGRNRHGNSLLYDVVPIQGYNTLSARLLHINHFRNKYKEIVENILSNQFTIEAQNPIIENLFSTIIPQLENDYSTVQNTLEKEKQLILTFIENRNKYLYSQLPII
ncbi:CotH kinase family protein [Bacillus sp. B1-b2]|uniref:CotH kinase family protein n=1 Tax=Bacillus sp. B1-b2 TaxID=2653201 RepID=UPI001261CFD2|nr:CotH kinase family protein [Bacillus sp. B1-b2]KAB7668413.1 spore coat protein [Bacillus sp. B1-b2]